MVLAASIRDARNITRTVPISVSEHSGIFGGCSQTNVTVFSGKILI